MSRHNNGNEVLVVERKPPLAWLTINRPEVMNCLNTELLLRLKEACNQLSSDEAINVVILTAAGRSVFCAGADLKERKNMTQKQTLTYLQLIQSVMSSIETLPQPVIAALNGSAYGGGTELALACDLRIMVEEADLRLTEVTLGIIPGAGGTQRLPRLVGKSVAKEMILAAAPITAKRAHTIGLVHRLVPAGTAGKGAFHERLMYQTNAWAQEVAQAAPLSLRYAKLAIDEGYDKELPEGLAVEAKYYRKLLRTRDRQEALQAFAEKRSPEFKGR